MGCLGNILWIIFGGGLQAIGWCAVGLLWSVTIIGLPVGRQCFKMAGLVFAPFGKDVVYDGGAVSLLMNILWVIFGGLPLAVAALVNGFAYCVTIIGIPFGLQCFKIAKLSLMPFGARIR